MREWLKNLRHKKAENLIIFAVIAYFILSFAVKKINGINRVDTRARVIGTYYVKEVCIGDSTKECIIFPQPKVVNIVAIREDQHDNSKPMIIMVETKN